MNTPIPPDELPLEGAQNPEERPFPGSKFSFDELLRPKKTIQIAPGGPVMITEPERQILDTPDFQRLRGVRQLGAAHWVYPTALHTRFDHSLGAVQIVTEMIQCVRGNEHSTPSQRRVTKRQEALARLYALLHDVTHVPFGHSIEDELGILERHDENKNRINRFLGKDSKIGQIIISFFGHQFHETLLAIYSWDENTESSGFAKEDAFVHDLVSNTVCADLLDYLRRDDYFCNLGVSMPYHFLKYLYLDTQRGSGATRVFVRLWKQQHIPRRDLLSDLCRLLEARYLLAERVYFHHAKINVSAMLGRAIQDHAITTEGGKMDKIEAWICEQSDETLLGALRNSSDATAKRLATAVAERRLHKCIKEEGLERVNGVQAAEHGESLREHIKARLIDPAQRRELENQAADLLFVDPGDVLFYAPAPKMNMKLARMKVLWKGEHIELKDIDDPVVKSRLDAILDAHRKLWSVRLLVARHLSEEQRKLAREFFQIEVFTLDADERQAKRHELCEKIIQNQMELQNWPQPTSTKEARAALRDAATDLLANHYAPGANGKRVTALPDAIKKCVQAHFPKPKSSASGKS